MDKNTTGASNFSSTRSYISSPELSQAVDISIALEKPLLIKGEPGTGKTVLAEAVAESLDMPLLTWHIKSTTKAQEGLYVHDTVQRLNDARFGEGDTSDISRYIKWGPLGQAIRSEERVVLLVDEIDKADLEFPNDLLHELDRMQFSVFETGETVSAKHRPLIIITSNNEKELPDAFLRRCIFHYIEFPSAELMQQILQVHHPDIAQSLLDQALEAFYWLRSQAGLRKQPSTSELIDWVAALNYGGIPLEDIQNVMPFIGTLLKNERDQDILQRAQQRRRQ